MSLLQWGHGDGAVEEFRPGVQSVSDLDASMGPRRWSRGRVHETVIMQHGLDASMGPRRWSRGREPRRASTSRARCRLQWGHGDGAVEEEDVRVGHGCGIRASMGPRRWSRGRGLGWWPLPSLESSFNGATAMEPWKRIGRSNRTAEIEQASMGPRRWSRGRVEKHRRTWGHSNRFNGATAMEPWKR